MLFIHGAIFADFLRPLAEQPAFSGFQNPLPPARSTARRRTSRRLRHAGGQASLRLLDHLEVHRAHLVGHSEGAMIALVLAASTPIK